VVVQTVPLPSSGAVELSREIPVVPAPPPTPALPLALPVPLDEPQLPIVEGWHAKPWPQSASMLHGSCQGNTHTEVTEVVHTGSLGGSGEGHVVPFSQGATAAPPEQAVRSCLWHSIPAAQSATLVQAFGSQVLI